MITLHLNAPNSQHDDEGASWNKVIIRHSTAWFILLFVGVIVWSMARPVLDERAASSTGKNPTPTSTTVAAQSTSKPPTSVVAGSTVRTLKPAPTAQKKPVRGVKNVSPGQLSLPSGNNRVQVMVDTVPVREKPNDRSRVLERLTRGTVVEVVSNRGSWLKVKTVDNWVGYIRNKAGSIREAP